MDLLAVLVFFVVLVLDAVEARIIRRDGRNKNNEDKDNDDDNGNDKNENADPKS